MKKKKILVITDHMPWGHRSIAKAIFGHINKKLDKDKYQINYEEVKSSSGVMNDVYTFMYRYWPSSHRIVYELLGSTVAKQLAEDFLDKNVVRLKKVVEKYQPDLVICSFFVHSQSLAKWREKSGKKFKLWTVVADPWTTNPMSFVSLADLHLVYDQRCRDIAIDSGIEPKRVMMTGWWVRPEMNQHYNQAEARKKLGFDDDRPIIFVGGGSMGTNSWPRILPMLLFTKKKVGVVINTGTDKLGKEMVDQYVKILQNLRRNDTVIVKNLGWIDNMAEVLAGCDIVFGKAGPNFLFDTIACNKPFVAITHIAGQEDGNIDLIKAKGLGWIKEENGELSRFFSQYLKNPKKYQQKYLETIAKESRFNRGSMVKITKAVIKELS